MPGKAAGDEVDIDLGRLFSSLARRWLRIAVVALLVTAAALGLAWLATPLYKGETRLLIEARESVFTRAEQNVDTNSPVLDEEGVTSQVQLIGSTDILAQVAAKLNLGQLPEFNKAADMSPVGRVLVMAGLKPDPARVPLDERVVKTLREKLSIYRVERSRVIVVEASSEDPALAEAIPNAIADTYLAVQQRAKSQTNADAAEWLKPEIADLSRRVKAAEQKVAAFRSQSDLFAGQNNSVLVDQQLSELSTELSRVRANRTTAEANAEAVRSALASGAAVDTLPVVLSAGMIQRLRETEVQLKAQLADLSSTLLPAHPRLRALNAQLADIQVQIRSEAQKVLAGLQGEARTAALRETELNGSVNQLKAQSARAGERQVDLRALERDATAQRALLESYMTRYREAASRNERNYSPVDARVFSRAVLPAEPFYPKPLPIAGAALVASLLVMAIVTLLGELFSGRAMRSAPRVRAEPIADIEMRPVDLLAAPVATVPARAARSGPPATEDAWQPALRPDWAGISVETAAERLITGGAARAIFVSPDGETAAAAAVLVAREVADIGLRALLVDLTSGQGAAWPMLERRDRLGITDLLAGAAEFGDVIHADHFSDCHVVPIGTADLETALSAGERLPIIVNSLTAAYDLVVIECGQADAEEIADLSGDGTVVVVSTLHRSEEATQMGTGLEAAGQREVILVQLVPPHGVSGPLADRSAA